MAEVLTISCPRPHPVTRAAAGALARAWQGSVGGQVRVSRGGGAPTGPQVELTLGSLVRPSVVVDFDVPYGSAAAEPADRLALTTAAWDGLDDVEPWRLLSAPLTVVPHWGRPDWDRPWVATMGGAGSSSSSPKVAADLGQLHVIGGWHPPPPGAVWWPSWSAVAGAVLGRATHVLGRGDPLVYDAIRAGISPMPVQGPGGDGGSTLDGALAGLVPPSLAGERRLWGHVARTAWDVHHDRVAPAPLMTPAWIGLGRERIREHLSSPVSAWERLRRRHDKLRRDPRRFLADSRHGPLRALGRVVFSDQGP